MKPTLQFSVPCLDYTRKDNFTSFEKVFYDLPGHDFPLQVGYFYIVNGWCNGHGQFNQVVKIVSPDGNSAVNTGGQIVSLTSKDVPLIMAMKFEKITFKEPGVYKVQVFLEDELVLEYPITLRRA